MKVERKSITDKNLVSGMIQKLRDGRHRKNHDGSRGVGFLPTEMGEIPSLCIYIIHKSLKEKGKLLVL